MLYENTLIFKVQIKFICLQEKQRKDRKRKDTEGKLRRGFKWMSEWMNK